MTPVIRLLAAANARIWSFHWGRASPRVAAPAVIMLALPMPMAMAKASGWKMAGAVRANTLPMMLKKAVPRTVPVM